LQGIIYIIKQLKPPPPLGIKLEVKLEVKLEHILEDKPGRNIVKNYYYYKGLFMLPVSQFATDFSVLLNTLIYTIFGSLKGRE